MSSKNERNRPSRLIASGADVSESFPTGVSTFGLNGSLPAPTAPNRRLKFSKLNDIGLGAT